MYNGDESVRTRLNLSTSNLIDVSIVLLRLCRVRLMFHPGFQLDRVRCRWSTLKVFFFLWDQSSLSSERIQNNLFCCYLKIRQLAGSKTLSLWMAAFGQDPQLAAFHTYCLSIQVPCYCLPTSTAFHVALFLNISPPKRFYFFQHGCRNVLHKTTPLS